MRRQAYKDYGDYLRSEIERKEKQIRDYPRETSYVVEGFNTNYKEAPNYEIEVGWLNIREMDIRMDRLNRETIRVRSLFEIKQVTY